VAESQGRVVNKFTGLEKKLAKGKRAGEKLPGLGEGTAQNFETEFELVGTKIAIAFQERGSNSGEE